jgi:hypothetical protein
VKIRAILLNATVFSGISLLVLGTVYLVDLEFLSSFLHLSPVDATFIEGIIFIMVGLVFLVGKGGINRGSLGAAMMSAKAKAIFGGDIVGPNEIFQQDAWKARGFTRTALILIFSGVLMILVYFVTL